MPTLQRRSDAWLGITLFISATAHTAVFLGIAWLQSHAPDLGQLQTTYYVDVVNLPVASPQAGSPAPASDQTDQSQVASAPQAGPTLAPTPTTMSAGKGSQTESQTFQQRMDQLKGKAADQRQSAALESLRQKVSRGRPGMPGAAGNQAGSDYTAYLHSRLKDAFRDTIQYQSPAPFVVVRLTIDRDGRIMRTRFEQSNHDKVFEKSVQRAIELAEQRIVPPPGRTTYEGTFVFKPQGVSQR